MAVSLRAVLDLDAADYLAARVDAAAADARERHRFRSLLREAYEEVRELEALDRHLPGTLKGTHAAQEGFVAALGQGALPPGVNSGPSTPPSVRGFGFGEFTPFPGAMFAPCAPYALVRPDKLFGLAWGVTTLAGPDAQIFDRSMTALLRTWERSHSLDHLYGLALRSVDRSGADPLAEELRRRSSGRQFPPMGHTPGEPGWPGGPDDPPGGTFPAGPGLPGGLGGSWPPPVDPPLDGPGFPPVGGGELVPDWCEFQRDLCRRMIEAAARGLRPGSLPVSVSSVGITGLLPNPACAGELMTIHGTFGATQPPDIEVLIGTQVVPVVSWSATAVVVRIPAGTRSGYVGFRDKKVEGARAAQFQDYQNAQGAIVEGLACLGTFVAWEPVIYQSSTPPATGTNFFQGTVPEIDAFTTNGVDELVVEPGTVFTLAWTVRNAITIRIHRTGSAGPALDVTNPAGNTRPLGPFSETTPVDAEYELVATNRCGSVTAPVQIRLRKWPTLTVEGIEVTQGIQVFWRPGIAWNSLATVAGKDTIVRVYISVAINGFMGDQQPQVTGTLNVGGTFLYPINGTSPTAAAGNPFITARARASIDRTKPTIR